MNTFTRRSFLKDILALAATLPLITIKSDKTESTELQPSYAATYVKGGYIIPPKISKQLIESVREHSVIRDKSVTIRLKA